MAEAERRNRGDGNLYRRGRVWWIQYYDHGKRYQESTRETDRRRAEKRLEERLADIRRGRFTPPIANSLTLGEILDDLVTDYEVNGRDSLTRAKGAIRHLEAYFERSTKIRAITGPRLNKYVRERKDEKASNSTIRYELAILRRAFRLQLKAGILQQIPPFPTIKVQNARQGFISLGDHRALLNSERMPDDFGAACRFAYWTGWRLRSEILPLTWSRVDFDAGVIRLEPGETKNEDGRTFPFDSIPELAELIKGQRARATGRYVFFREKTGRRITYRSFMEAWRAACKDKHLGDLRPHDYRRTAVRNLERAGVPRQVAMKLVGHKTESIYRRYAIVAEGDLREGLAKVARVGVDPTGAPPSRSPA